MARGMDEMYIPYGQPCLDEDDINAVIKVLRSPWLTTGPAVAAFEQGVCNLSGASFGVAMASGTAALHGAMVGLGIGPGDEVIVPAITFVASANAVLYQGGVPVFADVLPGTLLLDPADVRQKITAKTKAILAVDYAGQPCNYDELQRIATEHGLFLVADSCHAIGARYEGQGVGTLADLTIFSFHPVKHITTGEGGMVVCQDADLAAKVRQFRNHGIDLDHRQRQSQVTFAYDMQTLGYNYRISDIQCGLGLSQLQKLPQWLQRRQEIAALYDQLFTDLAGVNPLRCREDCAHAYHLYVVRFDQNIERDEVFQALREENIGVNVHYQPVYRHSYYRSLGYGDVYCPEAEMAYGDMLSLPMYIGLTDSQIGMVVELIADILHGLSHESL